MVKKKKSLHNIFYSYLHCPKLMSNGDSSHCYCSPCISNTEQWQLRYFSEASLTATYRRLPRHEALLFSSHFCFRIIFWKSAATQALGQSSSKHVSQSSCSESQTQEQVLTPSRASRSSLVGEMYFPWGESPENCKDAPSKSAWRKPVLLSNASQQRIQYIRG